MELTCIVSLCSTILIDDVLLTFNGGLNDRMWTQLIQQSYHVYHHAAPRKWASYLYFITVPNLYIREISNPRCLHACC